MKIGVDVSDLVTNRADGTTRYTRELVSRLPLIAPDMQWQYFAPGEFTAGTPLPVNVAAHISPWPKYWTQLRFPWEVLRYRPDVLFMPIQQLPIMRPKGMKTVAVIHDLAFHTFSQQTAYKDWLLLHAFTAQVAREADEIIAVSASTKADIAHYYGREKNVHVVHHGVDHARFHVPSEAEKETGWRDVIKAYPQLRKPYILYVGQIQPRKNLVRLIEAFEVMVGKNPDLQLVIAGGHGWKQGEILAKVKNSSAKQNIVMTGPVPDALLPALYWHASVFALVSLYEGFGMPVLEALACGIPVAVSNVSSLPEVAGAHAILVDPLDIDSIVQGITQALTNPPTSTLLNADAQLFSWDTCARETWRVLAE